MPWSIRTSLPSSSDFVPPAAMPTSFPLVNYSMQITSQFAVFGKQTGACFRTLGIAIALTLCLVPLLSGAEIHVRTVAGTGVEKDNGRRGPVREMNIGQPFGVEIGTDGALFVTEVENHRVWRIDQTSGRAEVIAGTGKLGYSGDGGLATEADMNEPYEIRFDSKGNAFVVEMKNHIVRRIDARMKRITTIAGTGQAGFGGDQGQGTAAMLNVPHGIVFSDDDTLFIADIGNHRIRRLDLKTGVISTFAGTGTRDKPVDGGLANESPLPGPRALAATADTLWVVLREGNSVWKIDLKTQRLTHLGGIGKAGSTGDGGPARDATFNGPKGLAVDAHHNLLIVDSENDTIRRIAADTGLVTTLAGQAKMRGFSGDDVLGSVARFSQPHGITVDQRGRIYVGDTRNHRVRVLQSDSE